MCKSRFSEEQLVKILREADKAPVAEIVKKYGGRRTLTMLWCRTLTCI
jgi:putative transposase